MYFTNINSLNELKTAYRQLAKTHHPDIGGEVKTMQKINQEYDCLFDIWKIKDQDTSDQTASSTRREFYTEFGYKGDRYDRSLSCVDLAKIFRGYLKTAFPTCRFSVQVSSGGGKINICLMEAPFSPFINPDDLTLEHFYRYPYPEEDLRDSKKAINKGYIDINIYYLEGALLLSDQAKELFKIFNTFLKRYHFDDSDSMIDYFHTNFYYGYKIGQWDKPFKIVPRTATKAQMKNAIILC